MNWALVLSGGGAKGLGYIGMFKAFEELGFPKPACIIGCSAGAIFGGLYCAGMSVKEMEDFFVEKFEISDYVEVSKIYHGNSKLLKILQLGSGIGTFMNSGGFDSGEKPHLLLKKLTMYKTFENTHIPFYCNASDLCSGKEICFESGTLADAMRASASFPGVFAPFPYEDKLLVDGCIKHNTPVWIAREKGFKNILAVTLGQFEKKEQKAFSNTLSVIFRCMDIASGEKTVYLNNCPTAILDLPSEKNTYDFSDAQERVLSGYNAVLENKEMLNGFFASGIKGFINRNKMKKQTKRLLSHERIF